MTPAEADPSRTEPSKLSLYAMGGGGVQLIRMSRGGDGRVCEGVKGWVDSEEPVET